MLREGTKRDAPLTDSVSGASEARPSARALLPFGHPGAGGSIGMADPDRRVGYGFTMNKMGSGLTGGQTGYAVLHAFWKALDR